MLEALKQLVEELTSLDARAAKFRDKTGRIEISADEFVRLAAFSRHAGATPPRELTIAEYVALIDEAIAAVLSRLNVEEAVDGIISEET